MPSQDSPAADVGSADDLHDLPGLYVPDGDLFVPTIAASGPWSPSAQHGGPVAALLCRAAEAVEAPGPMAVVRLTVELLRPAPLTPLSVRTRLRRPGRRVQLVDVALLDGDTEIAVATTLRLRMADVPIEDAVPMPGKSPDGTAPPPAPTADIPAYTDDRHPWLDTVGMDVRFVVGSLDDPGPSTAWFRMWMPLVAGEEPSPAQRAAVAADSGSGVGAALRFGRYTFLNPELSVHLARPPVGEWIAVQAGTMLGSSGSGVTTTRLWDLDGVVGQASAALMVELAADRP
jgi:Thioesterase-like superfamily